MISSGGVSAPSGSHVAGAWNISQAAELSIRPRPTSAGTANIGTPRGPGAFSRPSRSTGLSPKGTSATWSTGRGVAPRTTFGASASRTKAANAGTAGGRMTGSAGMRRTGAAWFAATVSGRRQSSSSASWMTSTAGVTSCSSSAGTAPSTGMASSSGTASSPTREEFALMGRND